MSALSRFLNLFRRGTLNQEFDEEIGFHLAERTKSLIQEGLSPKDAESNAHRRFGNIPAIKAQMREVRIMRRPIAVAVVVLSVIGGAVLWLSRTEPPTNTDIAYYRVSDQGVTPPKVISETKPSYPSEAQQAKIQGSVFMRCVVQTSGICEDIQVARSLDPMWLDREAVSALQQWRFTPGSRMGQPVPVLVDVEFSFTVR